MRRRALLLVVMAVATACARETSHADPACAFDETGCIPSELAIEVRAGAGTGTWTAVLHASSPTESWSQDAVFGGTGLQRDPGRIAPRVELSISGDADRADLRILHVGPDDGLEVVDRLELGADPTTVRLDNGERYVLVLRASPIEGTFSFLTVVP